MIAAFQTYKNTTANFTDVDISFSSRKYKM